MRLPWTRGEGDFLIAWVSAGDSPADNRVRVLAVVYPDEDGWYFSSVMHFPAPPGSDEVVICLQAALGEVNSQEEALSDCDEMTWSWLKNLADRGCAG